MTVREFYSKINGDYEGTLGRLMKEDFIRKYVLKFKTCDDMDNLTSSLESGNLADAFRFSHNLKGMSANLGFTVLGKSSSELCETLRPFGGVSGAPQGDVPDTSALYAKVVEDYNALIAAIDEIE